MHSRILVAICVLVVAASGAPAGAELASMVADLRVGTGPNPSSNPGGFVRLGSRAVFFPYFGKGHPWVTDGTAAGTRPLPGGWRDQEIGVLGDALLWFGYGSSSGDSSLWRTGGTAATTFALVEDGIDHHNEDYPVVWSRLGDEVYFTRVDGGARKLWATDGTVAGTRTVSTQPLREPMAMAGHGGRLFFVTAARGGPRFDPLFTNPFQLWRSDGTAAGTRLVAELPSRVRALRSASRRLLLFLEDELWVSDGSPSGTRRLYDPPGGPRIDRDLRILEPALGGRVFFFTGDFPDSALWVSDGTRGGTRPVGPGLGGGSGPAQGAVLGARLYVLASGALWSTAGTAATTERVMDLCAGNQCSFPSVYDGPLLVRSGGRLFFLAAEEVHGTELWTTDGTAAGTRMVRDVCPGPCGWPGALRAAGGEVFFYTSEPSHGRQLWASDGTEAGTRRLSDWPEPVSGSLTTEAPQLAVLGDRALTPGWDPRGGREPWAFDLAGGGGEPLGDLITGGEPGSEPFDLTALGDRVVFMACGDGPRWGLWSSRGIPGTTVELLALPETGCSRHQLPDHFVTTPLVSSAGGLGYLRLGDLWVTDGTSDGTVRLTDFGTAHESPEVVTRVVEVGGRAVFGVDDPTAGQPGETELWVTDGTPSGTRKLGLPPVFFTGLRTTAVVGDGDLVFWGSDASGGPGALTLDVGLTSLTRLSEHPALRGLGEPFGLVAADAGVYFLVEDSPFPSDERQLWRTDGTPGGTEELPPPSVDGSPQVPTAMVAFGESLLLFTTSTTPAEFRSRLWRLDGPGGEAVLIHDFGRRSFLKEEMMVSWNGELLFVFERPDGDTRRWDLYRTDGTAAGTVAVTDLTAIGVARAPLTVAGGRLFFSGYGELWISDGSEATTRRLQEIAPGAAGSALEQLTVAGSRLFFSADDGLHGRELWSLPLDALDAPCRPSATALCLGDGRFRAELFRHDRRGERGAGHPVAWSADAGAFWYYGRGNPEAVVKVVDGRSLNGAFWLFHGPLGDAEVALTVTDLVTGDSRRYPADPGLLPAFADLEAFPDPAAAGEPARTVEGSPLGAVGPADVGAAAPALALLAPPAAAPSPASEPCVPVAHRLCLQDGRFAVEIAWRNGQGVERPAFAFAHDGGRAGYFSFYGERDVQAAVKLLDGRPVNGAFWLFTTALTHLEYTLTVTDTATATSHVFVKPAGETSSRIDLTSVR